MSSLEKASVDGDIYPFVEFIANLVNESLRGTPVAKLIDWTDKNKNSLPAYLNGEMVRCKRQNGFYHFAILDLSY